MKPRTKARSLALQMLYELDLTNHPLEYIFETQLEKQDLDNKLITFAKSLVVGIAPLRKELDAYIAEHAPEWPIDQVSIIDRNLLRIALWEFAVTKETPVKVAINEAVELAKHFGSDSAPRFVNGVLGSLAERQNEIYLAFKAEGQIPSKDSLGS